MISISREYSNRQVVILLLTGLMLCSLAVSGIVRAAQQKPSVTIGVLAFRGHDHAMHRWQPVADFLNRKLPAYRFTIVPLDLRQVSEATAAGSIDFILTNPGNYVLLESRYGASRIATLKRYFQGQAYSLYGSVIFTRRGNDSITRLQDLKDKSLMVVSNQAFGGFQMAWRELKQSGIDPFNDLERLVYNGFPQDNIVYAVLKGEVDAGTVRTGLLENLALLGKINLEDLRVLHSRLDTPQFHMLVSTQLYPEWPLAKLSQTPDRLARKIVVALFSADSSEFLSPDGYGYSWTIPMDYSKVHELLHELEIGPYTPDRSLTLGKIIDAYGRWMLIVLLVIVALSILSTYVMRVNRRLLETQHLLKDEVRERTDAEAELEEHRHLLEQRVAERTDRLNDVNAKLEADIAARIRVEKTLRDSEQTLRELNRIASRYPVPLEEKIQALLEAGRSHFGFEFGTLYRRTTEGVEIVKRVVDSNIDVKGVNDIDAAVFDQLFQDERLLLTQQPINNHVLSDDSVVPGKNNCVAVKVVVEGEPFGILCLADSGSQTRNLNKVDRDILQLLADWIGMEIARKQAGDREQRHLADLAHVSRLGTMGELASGLAHELNQPLTAIANYIRGILRRLQNGRINDAELEAVLQQSVDEAERAAEVIRRLRAFVNKDDSLRKPLDMEQPVRQVAEFMAAEFESNRIDLVIDLQHDETLVMADDIQIEQVLINLVRNSIDALVEQCREERQIRIGTSHDDGGHLVVEVSDNAGMSAPDIDRIYDPFYTTKEDGMGLGLSISKTIIEAHGGKMYTESKNGITRTIFTLPIIDA